MVKIRVEVARVYHQALHLPAKGNRRKARGLRLAGLDAAFLLCCDLLA